MIKGFKSFNESNNEDNIIEFEINDKELYQNISFDKNINDMFNIDGNYLKRNVGRFLNYSKSNYTLDSGKIKIRLEFNDLPDSFSKDDIEDFFIKSFTQDNK